MYVSMYVCASLLMNVRYGNLSMPNFIIGGFRKQPTLPGNYFVPDILGACWFTRSPLCMPSVNG